MTSATAPRQLPHCGRWPSALYTTLGVMTLGTGPA
jgi:hypothetical protein